MFVKINKTRIFTIILACYLGGSYVYCAHKSNPSVQDIVEIEIDTNEQVRRMSATQEIRFNENQTFLGKLKDLLINNNDNIKEAMKKRKSKSNITLYVLVILLVVIVIGLYQAYDLLYVPPQQGLLTTPNAHTLFAKQERVCQKNCPKRKKSKNFIGILIIVLLLASVIVGIIIEYRRRKIKF